MNPDFKYYAAAELRTFLVAGHDTTSSAITYAINLLHSHPDFPARVRTEHDNVFGTDVCATPALLKSNPSYLNQLPLTLATIKESLRLFPPAGGIHMGSPEIILTAEDGTLFPTANCQVWVVHEAMHRNPAYWPSSDTYLPDRSLVGPEDSLYPMKGAWRAFEIGPHNCIGQTLAMTEVKTILVLTLRKFDIIKSYGEWDGKYPSKGMKTALGERAYQVTGGRGGQLPADRYPCRIAIRE
jgi:cytochrome P450